MSFVHFLVVPDLANQKQGACPCLRQQGQLLIESHASSTQGEICPLAKHDHSAPTQKTKNRKGLVPLNQTLLSNTNFAFANVPIDQLFFKEISVQPGVLNKKRVHGQVGFFYSFMPQMVEKKLAECSFLLLASSNLKTKGLK